MTRGSVSLSCATTPGFSCFSKSLGYRMIFRYPRKPIENEFVLHNKLVSEVIILIFFTYISHGFSEFEPQFQLILGSRAFS